MFNSHCHNKSGSDSNRNFVKDDKKIKHNILFLRTRNGQLQFNELTDIITEHFQRNKTRGMTGVSITTIIGTGTN